MLIVAFVWAVASQVTLSRARLVQRTGRFLIGWLKGISEWWDPIHRARYLTHFWPNGTMPNSEEFEALVRANFAGYALKIYGLVTSPKVLSLAELMAMPKQEQITEHFCIQGWSGVAKWGGVPMREILDLAAEKGSLLTSL